MPIGAGAIAGGVVAAGTLVLAVAVIGHAQQLMASRTLEEQKLELAQTPRVEAWLQQHDDYMTRSAVPLLVLIVQNLGQGTATDLRWWFEGVNEEQWRKRQIGGIWPSCREHAGGQQVLPAGARIPVVLTGGRNLHTEPGKADSYVEEVEPFNIVLEYRDLRGNTYGPQTVGLDPGRLYRSGGRGPVSALHDIAHVLRRKFQVQGPAYEENPLHGLSTRRVDQIRELTNISQGDGSATRVWDEQAEWWVGVAKATKKREVGSET